MPNLNATNTLNLQYTPPGSAVNSGLLSYTVTASCAAQNVGQIDITSSANPSDVIDIPFGSVGESKIFAVKNLGANEYGLKLNGTLVMNLAPGAQFVHAANVAPNSNPLTGASIVVLNTPSSTDYVQYFVFGD